MVQIVTELRRIRRSPWRERIGWTAFAVVTGGAWYLAVSQLASFLLSKI